MLGFLVDVFFFLEDIVITVLFFVIPYVVVKGLYDLLKGKKPKGEQR